MKQEENQIVPYRQLLVAGIEEHVVKLKEVFNANPELCEAIQSAFHGAKN